MDSVEPSTASHVFQWGAVSAAFGTVAVMFTSIVQNTVFAIKARKEMQRQDQLDKWAREDTKAKLAKMEEDFKELSASYAECQLKYQEAVKRIELLEDELKEASIRERAILLFIEKISDGQIKLAR